MKFMKEFMSLFNKFYKKNSLVFNCDVSSMSSGVKSSLFWGVKVLDLLGWVLMAPLSIMFMVVFVMSFLFKSMLELVIATILMLLLLIGICNVHCDMKYNPKGISYKIKMITSSVYGFIFKVKSFFIWVKNTMHMLWEVVSNMISKVKSIVILVKTSLSLLFFKFIILPMKKVFKVIGKGFHIFYIVLMFMLNMVEMVFVTWPMWYLFLFYKGEFCIHLSIEGFVMAVLFIYGVIAHKTNHPAYIAIENFLESSLNIFINFVLKTGFVTMPLSIFWFYLVKFLSNMFSLGLDTNCPNFCFLILVVGFMSTKGFINQVSLKQLAMVEAYIYVSSSKHFMMWKPITFWMIANVVLFVVFTYIVPDMYLEKPFKDIFLLGWLGSLLWNCFGAIMAFSLIVWGYFKCVVVSLITCMSGGFGSLLGNCLGTTTALFHLVWSYFKCVVVTLVTCYVGEALKYLGFFLYFNIITPVSFFVFNTVTPIMKSFCFNIFFYLKYPLTLISKSMNPKEEDFSKFFDECPLPFSYKWFWVSLVLMVVLTLIVLIIMNIYLYFCAKKNPNHLQLEMLHSNIMYSLTYGVLSVIKSLFLVVFLPFMGFWYVFIIMASCFDFFKITPTFHFKMVHYDSSGWMDYGTGLLVFLLFTVVIHVLMSIFLITIKSESEYKSSLEETLSPKVMLKSNFFNFLLILLKNTMSYYLQMVVGMALLNMFVFVIYLYFSELCPIWDIGVMFEISGLAKDVENWVSSSKLLIATIIINIILIIIVMIVKSFCDLLSLSESDSESTSPLLLSLPVVKNMLSLPVVKNPLPLPVVLQGLEGTQLKVKSLPGVVMSVVPTPLIIVEELKVVVSSLEALPVLISSKSAKSGNYKGSKWSICGNNPNLVKPVNESLMKKGESKMDIEKDWIFSKKNSVCQSKSGNKTSKKKIVVSTQELVWLGGNLSDYDMLLGVLMDSLSSFLSNETGYFYIMLGFGSCLLYSGLGLASLYEYFLLVKCLLMCMDFDQFSENFFLYEFYYHMYKDLLLIESFDGNLSSGMSNFMISYKSSFGSFYNFKHMSPTFFPSDYLHISENSGCSGFVTNSLGFSSFSKGMLLDYKDSNLSKDVFNFLTMKDSKYNSLVMLPPSLLLWYDNYQLSQMSGISLTPNEIVYSGMGDLKSVFVTLFTLQSMEFSKWYISPTSCYTDTGLSTSMEGVLVLGSEGDFTKIPLSDLEDSKNYFKGSHEAEAGGSKNIETLLFISSQETSWLGVVNYNMTKGFECLLDQSIRMDEIVMKIYFSPIFFSSSYCVNKSLLTGNLPKGEGFKESLLSISSDLFNKELSSKFLNNVRGKNISWLKPKKVSSSLKMSKLPKKMAMVKGKSCFFSYKMSGVKPSLSSVVDFSFFMNLKDHSKEGILTLVVLGGVFSFSNPVWKCKCCGPMISLPSSCSCFEKEYFSYSSKNNELIVESFNYPFVKEILGWPPNMNKDLEVMEGMKSLTETTEGFKAFEEECETGMFGGEKSSSIVGVKFFNYNIYFNNVKSELTDLGLDLEDYLLEEDLDVDLTGFEEMLE